jgi:7-cyano-7-deazaguanine synthase
VWVPNRNGLFISIAAAVAESRGLNAVAVGFNREEAATFPDNSAEYLFAQERALSFSTANKVRLVSSTLHLNKTEIVSKLKALDFPMDLLWSCYEAGPERCHQCESCARYDRAVLHNLENSGNIAQ